MKLIFEISESGKRCATIRKPDVAETKLNKKFLRAAKPELPEVSEVDFSRHYTALSRRAFGVDNGFYPLGSCTMKYNPKINEEVAALPGFTKVHPLQSEQTVQGSLEVMHTLSAYLAEITGMDGVTLQPNAGAHGEYTGLLLIAADHA